MILERDKVIWIGNPRSGSTSLLRTFSCDDYHHDPMQYYCDIKKDKIHRYKCYMVVRNPWDRMVSWWHQHTKKSGHWMCEYKTFSEWILSGDYERWTTHPRGSDPRLETKWYWENHSPLIQKNFIKNDLGVKVNLIKLENLKSEFRLIHPERNLRHENTSGAKKGHYRTYYTEEALQVINKFLEEDIELLDYTY